MKISNKRAITGAVVTGGLLFALTACLDDGSSAASSAQNTETNQAAGGISALLQAQPVHKYSYSQLRQNLQDLEDAQANGTITTSFFMHLGNQDPVFSCPSIGAPIASTTELTNPQQMVEDTLGSTGVAMTSIGQMDPTGVYTGQSSGTYIMCVGKDGSVNPVYWEGDVMTAFGPAHWDKSLHQMVIDGAAGSKFSGLKK